jgi:hypothetical protein
MIFAEAFDDSFCGWNRCPDTLDHAVVLAAVKDASRR